MKQVMVVRTDIKMGKGKIAAQCCHAAIGAYKQADKAKIRKWENEAYAKVVLKAPSLQDLYNLRELARANGVAYYLVTDAGRTQLPKSTVTVLGLGPDEDDILDMIDFTGVREIGDIIINLDRVKSQSLDYGHSERREMCFLFTHGLLHLLGYDHMKEDEEKEMFTLQEEILRNLNINR